MILSLILCEAIVLFFELLVPRSPGKLTGRNLLFCTQYIEQSHSLQGRLQEQCMFLVHGGVWGRCLLIYFNEKGQSNISLNAL